MAMTYKEIEHRLVEKLRQIQDMFELMEPEPGLIERIRSNISFISTKQYAAAVVGQFKRGKSSLINTLLGHAVLPADVLPATATINRITFGGLNAELKSVAKFKNGTTQAIGIGELFDYVTKVTPEGACRAAQIEEVVVYAPAKICENYIDIIDTPGLNDDAEMTRLTYNALNAADAVIFTISARYPGEDTEINQICDLICNTHIHSLLFAVTFIDTFDEDADSEEEYNQIVDKMVYAIRRKVQESVFQKISGDNDENRDRNLEKAHRLLDKMHIFGISSKYALNAFSSNNAALRRKSRFDAFNNQLISILTTKQIENTVKKTATHIHTLLDASLYELYLQKKSYYESYYIKLKDQKAAAYAQFPGMSGAYRRELDEIKEGIQHEISDLNEVKNQLARLFVTTLSSVKENSDAAIKQAILHAAAKGKSQMEEIYLPMIWDGIWTLIRDAAARFAQDQRQALDFILQHIRMPYRMGHSLTHILAEEEALPEFEWDEFPAFNHPNLKQYDIMDSILVSIDLSVNNLMKKMEAYAASALKSSAGKADDESSLLADAIEQYVEERKQATDIKLKALLNNYAKFSADAKDITAECDHLMKELYHIGVQ